ncbi:hypothetical protein Tco_1536879, partial [Tanacetum coccineum]
NNLSAFIIACTLSYGMLASLTFSAFSLASLACSSSSAYSLKVSIGVSVGLVVDSPGSLKVMLLALGIVEGVVVVVLCTGSYSTTLGFALLNSAKGFSSSIILALPLSLMFEGIGVSVVLVVDSPRSLKVMLLALGIS